MRLSLRFIANVARSETFLLLARQAQAESRTGCSFYVFCDARRPDLIERLYRIIRAVRPFELRYRLKLVTWQEISETLRCDVQEFLETKYVILPLRYTEC